MSSSVGVDLKANTGQALKELQNFGKQVAGIAKVWENVMGGRGSRQAGANLQQLSKGVDQLGKAADRANQRLQAINQTLEQTVKTRVKLLDAQGRVGQKDKDQYNNLLQQEKMLASQQRSWQNIAAIRSRMAVNSGMTPGENGMFAPRGAVGAGTGGMLGSAFAGLAGGGAGAITELLGGAISGIVAGGGAMAIKGFGAAMKMEELEAKFLPRMRPGGMASMNMVGLNRRMRGIGRPLAYNAEESIAAFQAMSEGGGNFGHGLERDTKASMQFARMFGLDMGGVTSMNATAQRMGAFKAGDAKKFAGMLATEIARTGLGPRAQEVQEATLMLMNQQMQSNPRASAAPLMALQTILNKTGVPAFQGTAGASFINQLNQGITNPGSEGTEALLMQAAQKAGVHTLFGFEMFKGQGLNNAKTLPAILRTILEGSHGNGQIAQMALQQGFNLPLPKVHALFQATHGFRDLSSGAIKSAMKGLQGQEGFLDNGAKTTTDAFNSLAIKQAQIVIHEATLRVGENILPKVAGVARDFAKSGGLMADVADSKLPFSKKANKWADIASKSLGLHPGGADDKALHFGAGLVGVIGEEVAKSKEFERTHPGQKRRLGQILNEVIDHQMQRGFGRMFDSLNAAGDAADPGTGAKWHLGPGAHLGGLVPGALGALGGAMHDMRKAGLHPTITSAFRTRAEQQRARRLRGMGLSPYPAAQPGLSAHERGTAVDISVPHGERDQVTGIMAAHGFAHNVPGDPVHYSYAIHIHDHTSDHRAKRLVKDAIQEHHHETTRSKVNTHNKRR